MIVCRKPWTLYDVDVAGMAGVVVVGLVAWWLVVVPWQRVWNDYRGLTGVRSVSEDALHKDMVELERFERGLEQLEGVVAAQTRHVPRADSFSRLLKQMTDLAREASLELVNVAPQPATASGAYLVSDVQVGGRGRSQDFIRFLDRLALDNACQSLQACSITRATKETQPTCELTWTVRLYLLPADAEKKGGEGT